MARAAGEGIEIGGQDCRAESHGAFTGDVSAAMSEVDPSERPPEIPLDELLDGLTLGAATSVALNVDRALALAQVCCYFQEKMDIAAMSIASKDRALP
jgi:hypothetical protein